MRKSVVISVALVMALLSAGAVMSQEGTGACCKPDSGCSIMTASECALVGGTYKGDGTSCKPNPCDCCGADGTEMRGNADGIGGVNVLDILRIIRCAFFMDCLNDCKLEQDVNASGSVNVVDITYLVAYLFQSGPPPAMCP
ncbi:MAG: hypothetical protein AAB305_07345 [Candidatus Zixiibacteriota bacterium]